jgi:hypothetical protein
VNGELHCVVVAAVVLEASLVVDVLGGQLDAVDAADAVGRGLSGEGVDLPENGVGAG